MMNFHRLQALVLLCTLAVLNPLASWAQTFPIDLKQRVGGLRLVASAHAPNPNSGLVILTLTNYDDVGAACEATFDIRAQPAKTYAREIAPDEQIQIHHRARAITNRMTIDLRCQPVS